LEEVSTFARKFARKRGFNSDTAEELFQILVDAFNSSRSGKLGVVKATALAMQFAGIAIEAVDEEIRLR
jgi:hypothetical protein